MLLKISAVLCVLISIHVIGIQGIICDGLRSSSYRCKISALEIPVQMYQEGALLRVINGTFTIDLVGDDSTPKKIYAQEKGIVNVNKGFARIPTLESLSLEDNSIAFIESSVFEGLPGLVHLSLARNKISYLAADSFAGLAKLEVLNLEHNALTEFSFSITRGTLPALRDLHLEHNGIRFIDIHSYGQDALMCDSNLQHLYLTDNAIERFKLADDSNSSCLKNLNHLYLEDNLLTNLDAGNVPLEALSLDGNLFTSPPRVNPELRFLSVARNGLRYIGELPERVNIVHLILSYNYIDDSLAYYEHFQNISSLEHLALDHNEIRSIPDGFLSNLSSLRSLDLTHNRISHVSPTAFANLPSLLELSLENNSLTSFPGTECFGESNLSYLDLSNNNVENVSDIQANMIPKLKVLKLTGNPLKRIGPHSVSPDVEILL